MKSPLYILNVLRVYLDRTYFVETENWKLKTRSKIICKCVNSAMRPIFNEKVIKIWYL